MKPNAFSTAPRRWICLAAWLAACGGAWAAEQAAPRLQLELAQPLGGDRRATQQLLLSPDGQRAARLTSDGAELWQLQPPRSLAKIPSQKTPTEATASRTGWREKESMAFDGSTGRLHYLSHAAHLWLNPDLTQGTADSDTQSISPDGRYALRYNTVGDKPGQLPPRYPGARDDIYDLREQRSACQLPGTAAAGPGAFGGDWFAAQLRSMGPSLPRPLVVCDMKRGQVFAISRDKRGGMEPVIDPQGRFLQITTSGTGFFGGGVERQLHALPLPAAGFATGQGDAPECREIPCGQPAPLDLPEKAVPWTRDISPDGQWWITLAQGPLRAEFFRMDGRAAQKASELEYPSSATPSPGPKHRVVFSRNSRWAGLQFEQRLYLVDLQAAKVEPAEVRVDAKVAFEVQAIADNGTDWLLRDAADGSASGVWRLKR